MSPSVPLPRALAEATAVSTSISGRVPMRRKLSACSTRWRCCARFSATD